ncbi:connectin [Amyelois transitella]|uniref:connectin n=1 Tax=Amyelois transitella TaxID=680683 RepID=UPI00067BAC56|nr:connectin [Amyelois transitella]
MWKIILIAYASWALVDSKIYNHHKRETATSLCDPLANNTNRIQCYCVKNSLHPEQMKIAECFLTTKNVESNDSSWDEFIKIQNITKLTLTNTKGISLDYIPTNAIKYTKGLTKLAITYGNIEKVPAFAFANLTQLDEIKVRDNNIKTLEKYAFAHHNAITSISLDNNAIVEINRDVFIDLPSLENLYLTANKITTIHDRAFVHLNNLRELEIDKNRLFSLNIETFRGLHKLRRLVLSSNSLEVIGANTFVHLVELRSLSLDANQIQMLDEKAFSGLTKLTSLTLARNKLVDIENPNTFEGLDSLRSLSLRDNQLNKVRADVMAPIVKNLHTPSSFFDYEGNKFPCDCHLDWFLKLMNETQSTVLKNTIENLKCYPSDALREAWKKVGETEQTEQLQEEEPQNQSDYEYYDESQLNGTLFYTDVRFLLNCSGDFRRPIPNSIANENVVTKAYSSPLITTPLPVTNAPGPKPHKSQVTNHGLLDLAQLETVTTETPKTVTDSKRELNKVTERNVKKMSPTTSRLATVSAKPIDKSYDVRDMASDEAKPEKLNARRSYQEELKPEEKSNNSQRNVGCVTLTSIIIMLSLRSFL